jgi:hypothetical protein
MAQRGRCQALHVRKVNDHIFRCAWVEEWCVWVCHLRGQGGIRYILMVFRCNAEEVQQHWHEASL